MIFSSPIIVIAILSVLVWAWWRFVYFNRNPQRVSPPGDDLVCPADGRVIYAEVVNCDSLPAATSADGAHAYYHRVRDAWDLHGTWSVVATYLSIFDVHFVRSPLSGRVSYRSVPAPGRNHSMEWPMVAAILKRPLPLSRTAYRDKNEMLVVKIDAEIPIVMVLMADWWIRQIQTFVPEGGHVERGGVLAHIRMGSQVDVWVPSGSVTFSRSPFDAVFAGETILGVQSAEPRAAPAGEGVGPGDEEGTDSRTPLSAPKISQPPE